MPLKSLRGQLGQWRRFVGSDEQLRCAAVYSRATIGLVGSLVMWVGLWNLLTEGRVEHVNMGPHDVVTLFHVFLTRTQRTLLYLCGGWALCVWSDCITWQTGCWSHLWHPKIWGVGSQWARVGLCLRFVVGLAGMLGYWTGMNDILDFNVGARSPLRKTLFLVVGLIGVVFTDTLQHMAYVYCEDTRDERVLTYKSPLRARALEVLRCTVSAVSQAAIWLATWNLMGLDEYTSSEGGLLYPSFLVASGTMCMLYAGSYVATSWVVFGIEFTESAAPSQQVSLLFFARALVSIAGFVLFVSGGWVLLDQHLFPDSTLRNALFAVIGMAMCFAVNSLAANVLSILEVQDDEEEALENDDLAPLLRQESDVLHTSHTSGFSRSSVGGGDDTVDDDLSRSERGASRLSTKSLSINQDR